MAHGIRLRGASRRAAGIREVVSRLARSRLAIIEHIAPPSHARERDAPAGWFAPLSIAAGTWWRVHPANLLLALARPVLSQLTRRSPWWCLAGAATGGALLGKLRARRLLSLSSLLAFARASQLSGLAMSALSALADQQGPDREPYILLPQLELRT